MIPIREFKEADTNFVISTWLRSYYSNQTGYKEKAETFYACHQKQIKKLWNSKDLLCYVAHDPNDEDIIFGFAVFGTDYTLHYVCVKEIYKKMGVCKALLTKFYKARDEITVSHWTKDCAALKKLYKLNYNRYKFFQ
jgi:hypothetical protein